MAKVNAVKLNSANVKYDNSVDTERVYDVESNVNFQENRIISFDGGVVRKDEVVKATFSKHGNNQESLTFQNVEREEKYAIIEAVDAFFADVEAAVEVSPLNI
jgi:hypothetical protein